MKLMSKILIMDNNGYEIDGDIFWLDCPPLMESHTTS